MDALRSRLELSGFFALFLFSHVAWAADPNPAPAPAPVPSVAPTTAPATEPFVPSPELRAKVAVALDQYATGHYDEALTSLDIADKLSPNNADLINLRGAIYVKQQLWDKALAQFNQVLTINTTYFPARFNLGEVPFLQKKYAEARTVFEKLLKEDPTNELLEFKIFLTYLLEGNLDTAKIWLDKFDFTGSTPAYYFAQAAWSFQRREDARANDFITSAVSIFSPQMNNLFAESLVDQGWLKRNQPAPTPTAQSSQ